ncbi:MAG: hypothetical protein U0929_16940 [Planctomycetaceae bacterium]
MTPLNPSFLPLPQTAADLLDGLLRSQLFAESIHSQILKQSRPFLKHAADEYAAALVQRKVLTGWQASELLAGRVCFYAGTFRLLGPLSIDPSFPLFIAEQSGAQRLVLLEATPRVTNQVASEDGITGGIGINLKAQPPVRDPHVARCVQVQTTATHNLVAYEFHQAAWLGDIISQQLPQRPHRAHLLAQLAATMSEISREALETFDPQHAVIDHEGHLRWLAGPRALVNDWTDDATSGRSRQELQLLAIRKFASWLGGHPEISHCSNLAEVISTLCPIAEPWTEAFPQGAMPGSRAILNRMLRKGPSLAQIESFHTERQYALITPPAQPPLQFTPQTESTGQESREPSAAHSQRPQRRRTRSTSGGRAPSPASSRPATSPVHPNVRRKLAAQDIAPGQVRTLSPTRIRSPQLILTAAIAAVVTGMLTMQWIWRWSVPEAKAQTEARTDSK